MGYGSAGYTIFDPVARALLDAGAPDEVITNTCAQLIKTLTEQDWDTLDESIEQFRDQPAVIAAFRQAAPEWLSYDDESGELWTDPATPDEGTKVTAPPPAELVDLPHRLGRVC
jgi:hypothetical protein